MLVFPSPRNSCFNSSLSGLTFASPREMTFHTHSFQNLGFSVYLSLIWVSLAGYQLRDINFIDECKRNFDNIKSWLFLVSVGSGKLYFDLNLSGQSCLWTVCCCITLGSIPASLSLAGKLTSAGCIQGFALHTRQEKEGRRRRRCLFLTLHPVLPLFCSVAQAGLSMAKFSLAALPKLSQLRSLAEALLYLVLKAHNKWQWLFCY